MEEMKGSGCFIGRTETYYNEDENCLYTPEYWTYSDSREDSEFSTHGPVYELTEEGKRELDWMLECRRMNEYQRRHCFGYRNNSSEEMWEILTNPKNEYIVIN